MTLLLRFAFPPGLNWMTVGWALIAATGLGFSVANVRSAWPALRRVRGGAGPERTITIGRLMVHGGATGFLAASTASGLLVTVLALRSGMTLEFADAGAAIGVLAVILLLVTAPTAGAVLSWLVHRADLRAVRVARGPKE